MVTKKRYVYGTRSKKWHQVGKSDRDFIHGIESTDFRKMGKKAAREKYLGARFV